MNNRAIWAERVVGWKSSGLTSEKYCEGKPFTAGGLRHWARCLRQTKAREPQALTVRIAKVVPRALVDDGSAVSVPLAPLGSARSPESLYVEVGALRVAVRPGFDRVALAAVIDVLAAREVRS